jgi:hypothetical protein
MKKQSLFLACLVALALTTTRAEQTNKPAPAAEAAVVLTKFDLDFPGGRPQDLVSAIRKAMGKPLNAIIPREGADMGLPPLKMNNVDAPQLFLALERASLRRVTGMDASGSPFMIGDASYGFYYSGHTPTDDTIYYFHVDRPVGPNPPKTCRFYALEPYLNRGLTVDDITTAIQTAWKMMGEEDRPAISFHKDTKLLIAVGEASKLKTIDAVLKALEPPALEHFIDPNTGLPIYVDPNTGLTKPKAEPKAKQ